MCTSTSLSTRARESQPVEKAVSHALLASDLVRILEQCREIYRKLGRPLAPKHEQLAIQLMLSLDEEACARLPERLPNYLKWAALYLWSDPQHTKSLLNVLRDGDWDVELSQRNVPAPKKPSLIEQQTALYFARAASQKD